MQSKHYYTVYIRKWAGFSEDILALNDPSVHLVSLEDIVRAQSLFLLAKKEGGRECVFPSFSVHLVSVLGMGFLDSSFFCFCLAMR